MSVPPPAAPDRGAPSRPSPRLPVQFVVSALDLALASLGELFSRSDALTGRVLRSGFRGAHLEYRAIRRFAEARARELLRRFVRCQDIAVRASQRAKMLLPASTDESRPLLLARMRQADYPPGLDGLSARALLSEYRLMSRGERLALVERSGGLGLGDAAGMIYRYALVMESCAALLFFGEVCLVLNARRERFRAVDEGVLARRAARQRGALLAALGRLRAALSEARFRDVRRLAGQLRRQGEGAALRVARDLADVNETRRARGGLASGEELAMSSWLRELGGLRAMGFYFRAVAACGIAGHEGLAASDVQAARSLRMMVDARGSNGAASMSKSESMPESTLKSESTPVSRPIWMSVGEVKRRRAELLGRTVEVEGLVAEIRSTAGAEGEGPRFATVVSLRDPESGAELLVRAEGNWLADNGARRGARVRMVVAVEREEGEDGIRASLCSLDLRAGRERDFVGYAAWAVRGLWDGLTSGKDFDTTFERERRDVVPEAPSAWERDATEYGEINAQADVLIGAPDAAIVYEEWRRSMRDVALAADRAESALLAAGSGEAAEMAGDVEVLRRAALRMYASASRAAARASASRRRGRGRAD